MIIVIGLVVVFGSIIAGYTMHHGNLAVLLQIGEFIIIGGCGLGALLVGNSPRTVRRTFRDVLGLLKPPPITESAYTELLRLLYDIFQTARRDGLVGVEAHVEDPYASELFARYPHFLGHPHAVAFLTDTLKVLLSGAVEDHHLADILEVDLESRHEEEMIVSHALSRIGDAMPAFGIVAAVLGVIITMGYIGGEAVLVGQKIAAALVGTFLGVLLAYGVFYPIAQALEGRARAEQAYLGCIRTAIVSFSRGDSPMTSVEFARRNIEPADRPSFAELEELTRRKAA